MYRGGRARGSYGSGRAVGSRNKYGPRTLVDNWEEERYAPGMEALRDVDPLADPLATSTKLALSSSTRRPVKRFGAGIPPPKPKRVTGGILAHDCKVDSSTWKSVSHSAFARAGARAVAADEEFGCAKLKRSAMADDEAALLDYRRKWTKEAPALVEERFSTERLISESKAVADKFVPRTTRPSTPGSEFIDVEAAGSE
eukprot:PLAT1744.1.p1 GENE.PLAT1744.1~~PLAT1744.1.p1  ORF type:complete len:213 (-),score=68.44 PLAT1744.1:92-688(-)